MNNSHISNGGKRKKTTAHFEVMTTPMINLDVIGETVVMGFLYLELEQL